MNDEFVFKVNLGGMIDILSNHLYSSPDVFVRELLQNGTDAISGRQIHDKKFKSGKISIIIDEGKTIKFSDNGIGLTKDEIHKFLAVIGQSSKRDLETGKIMSDYIGRFGIGMLSCFMVTDEIEIRTRSAKEPESSYIWRGKPDGTYTIQTSDDKFDIGTQIIINSKKHCEEYFSNEKVEKLVEYYGLPLPFPIMLKQSDGFIRINRQFSLEGNVRNNILDFGDWLFDEEFLDYIPLESKNGLFSGVAYILPYQVAASYDGRHRIYLKNMLLTEDGSKILPKWAFFLRCFFNTSTLRPTASRENFYEDELLDQSKQEISQCISVYLKSLSYKNPKLLEKILDIHSLAIKSMAVEEKDIFCVFAPYIKFQTNYGEISGKELLRHKNEITYTSNINKFQQASSVLISQDQLLINTCYVYDDRLLEMFGYEYDLTLIPLSVIDFDNFFDDIPDKNSGDVSFFEACAEEALEIFNCDAQVKTFQPDELSVFYIIGSDAEIYRDIGMAKEKSDDIFSSMFDSFAGEIKDTEATLYFNYNNPLIKKLVSIKNAEKISCCCQVLYVQSLLSGHYPLKKGELSVMNSNIIKMLEWGIEN